MSKKERLDKIGDQQKKFKNIFCKNFGNEFTNDKLLGLFQEYGEITSCVVMTDDSGTSKGFGFIAFENHEDAERVSISTKLNKLEQGGQAVST